MYLRDQPFTQLQRHALAKLLQPFIRLPARDKLADRPTDRQWLSGFLITLQVINLAANYLLNNASYAHPSVVATTKRKRKHADQRRQIKNKNRSPKKKTHEGMWHKEIQMQIMEILGVNMSSSVVIFLLLKIVFCAGIVENRKIKMEILAVTVEQWFEIMLLRWAEKVVTGRNWFNIQWREIKCLERPGKNASEWRFYKL